MVEDLEYHKELLELMVKAGRRCAYDLRHAADHISDKELAEIFSDSADYWLTIFNPAQGPKDYRTRMHHEIYTLEMLVNRLSNLALEHGATQNEIDAVKF